jgi:hypothetical protein
VQILYLGDRKSMSLCRRDEAMRDQGCARTVMFEIRLHDCATAPTAGDKNSADLVHNFSVCLTLF